MYRHFTSLVLRHIKIHWNDKFFNWDLKQMFLEVLLDLTLSRNLLHQSMTILLKKIIQNPQFSIEIFPPWTWNMCYKMYLSLKSTVLEDLLMLYTPQKASLFTNLSVTLSNSGLKQNATISRLWSSKNVTISIDQQYNTQMER